VSADVQYTLKPNFNVLLQLGGHHGSPHESDNHVPILFWGPNWVPAGRVDTPVEVVDIAPTLARLMGVFCAARVRGQTPVVCGSLNAFFSPMLRATGDRVTALELPCTAHPARL
jgi:hypothetical protein